MQNIKYKDYIQEKSQILKQFKKFKKIYNNQNSLLYIINY